MLPVLVMLTSRSDSSFERSNISLKGNKGLALIRTLTVSTTAFERTKEKFYGFRQTELVMLLTFEIFERAESNGKKLLKLSQTSFSGSIN